MCCASSSRTVVPSSRVPCLRAARLTDAGTGVGSAIARRRSASVCIGRSVVRDCACAVCCGAGIGAIAADSCGGHASGARRPAPMSSSSSAGRATAFAAPTVSFQFGISTPPASGVFGSGRPVSTATSSTAAPRPSRTRRSTGWASPETPTGLINSRTPFSAANAGCGRSQVRGKSSMIWSLAISANRSDVTASSAGMSTTPPTMRTCPSHWMLSASSGCHIWKDGRSTRGRSAERDVERSGVLGMV